MEYHVICKQRQFYSFLSNLDGFMVLCCFIFSCLIPLATISIQCSLEVVEAHTFALFLILRKIIQSFTIKYDVKCRFLVGVLYQVSYFPSILNPHVVELTFVIFHLPGITVFHHLTSKTHCFKYFVSYCFRKEDKFFILVGSGGLCLNFYLFYSYF